MEIIKKTMAEPGANDCAKSNINREFVEQFCRETLFDEKPVKDDVAEQKCTCKQKSVPANAKIISEFNEPWIHIPDNTLQYHDELLLIIKSNAKLTKLFLSGSLNFSKSWNQQAGYRTFRSTGS
jgi:hypothetical protein